MLHATAIAVAAVVIGVAGTLGLVGLRDGDGTKLVSRAQLAALPSAPAGAHGAAEIVHAGSAIELRLTLTGMPTPNGYYEAWLFDPATGTMYPMGPLTESGGTVTVTGIDLGRYRGVDISAQPMDGSGGHGESMLRGALR
jgi:Anti-sigma-K factor rskA, C-terminal